MDEYYWAKNIRPCAEKDVDRNTATNYIMRHLKTERAIMKTCDPNGRDYLENSKDLVPFVMYSANKQRRWETVTSHALMEKIRGIHCSGTDVILMECVNLSSAYMPYTNYYQFPVRHFHRLLSDDTYEHIGTSSVKGASYKPLFVTDPINRKTLPQNVIAYHFITPPKNYENLMKNEFSPGSSVDKYYGSRTIAHEKRNRNKQLTQFMLKHTNTQYEGLNEDVNLEDDCEVSCDDVAPPRQFYNLEDHIVDKYVMVKQRKSEISECSDTWSVISDN